MKVGQLKYIDSLQFMTSSLTSLTKNFGDNHPIMTEYFKKQGYSSEQISLAYRKGNFSHEYIDSHDRFKETELPLIHEFHSVLGERHLCIIMVSILAIMYPHILYPGMLCLR
ncbi:15936_t:CDS:2 [Funneliformis geosporum]|uniref:15936_t:CDS:1 n=1 Tax=Funneliformis geosporum TaxID=1117311 RepID=A0A9W4X1E9_9GLOM|nr:15936_t:CDS:2 [Funneliformis geosporum]